MAHSPAFAMTVFRNIEEVPLSQCMEAARNGIEIARNKSLEHEEGKFFDHRLYLVGPIGKDLIGQEVWQLYEILTFHLGKKASVQCFLRPQYSYSD